MLVAMIVAGCKATSVPSDDDPRPLVVATTTMLEDMARQLGGDVVRVEGIMSPGSDPHLYQPRPGDARLMAKSQMVVMNGLFLEGWIEGLVRHAGGERRIVVASENITPIAMRDSPGGVDPHFWFDILAWRTASESVGQAMVELVGPKTAQGAIIRQRSADYAALLERLHSWIEVQLATIPSNQRVLVTSHDAFNYFGRAYSIDVEAIQGISTEQEASQRDVANMIDLVRKRNAPAVFVETSVNPSLINQVGRATGARVAGPLFSDSIGVAGGPADTFVKTVVENVRMITEALGGQYTPFELASQPIIEEGETRSGS